MGSEVAVVPDFLGQRMKRFSKNAILDRSVYRIDQVALIATLIFQATLQCPPTHNEGCFETACRQTQTRFFEVLANWVWNRSSDVQLKFRERKRLKSVSGSCSNLEN